MVSYPSINVRLCTQHSYCYSVDEDRDALTGTLELGPVFARIFEYVYSA